MEILVVWLGCALAVGVLAARWHRSGTGWALLAAVISPLLAGLLLLALGRRQPAGVAGEGHEWSAKTHGRCPECRELIRLDARRCKHCGAAVTPARADLP